MNKAEHKKIELTILSDVIRSVEYSLNSSIVTLEDYTQQLADLETENKTDSYLNDIIEEYTVKVEYCKKLITLLEKEI